MNFEELVKVARKVENTTSRKEKIRLLADFFSRLNPEEAAIAARLLSGRIFPEYRDVALGVGWSTLREALSMKSTVKPLTTFYAKVTLKELVSVLEKTANTSSRKKKISYIYSLISRMSDEEIEFLLRIIFGEVRIGANIGILLETAAKLAHCKLEIVRRAYMYLSDIGDVISTAIKGGCKALETVKITLFRPVKPMLAAMAYTVEEILREHGGKTALEYKYDGVRVQVHRKGRSVKVFSRRLSDITPYVPEAVSAAEKAGADEFILDGEAVGVEGGKPIAFQEISRRIRRKKDKEKFFSRIPLHVYFFDILYLNGRDLTSLKYIERRRILESICNEECLARMTVTSNLNEASSFYSSAIEAGHEGVMAKRLDSPYEPGTRGKHWLKLKASDTIDCVIVAAEWGHGRRSGWLSDYHLAVYDEKNDRFVRVGKTYKGLTDAEFEEMTKRLLELKVAEEDYIVYVKPEIVVEVEYAEIQRSPRYESGYALRFARIKRIRWDRSPYDITTLEELEKRYQAQHRRGASGENNSSRATG